jgi:hypothetical protein
MVLLDAGIGRHSTIGLNISVNWLMRRYLSTSREINKFWKVYKCLKEHVAYVSLEEQMLRLVR